ncbi:MAG TPA: O-antigen ligase family protein [bacterium]|nr:O-antigen ligase family protein [bacterium]
MTIRTIKTKLKYFVKKINLKVVIEYLFYFFVFIFLWQTKLIIYPGDSNYSEIALFANYILLSIILILFFIYKIKNKEKDSDIDKYWVILAGLDFFIFLSILISSNLTLSVFRYILLLLSIGLMYVMINFKFKFKKIILVFLLALLLQAGLGIGQFFTQKTFACKYLGIALHEASDLGTAVIETNNERFLRAYGATDHPNIFGALMFFAIFFVILLMIKNNYKGTKATISYLALFFYSIALCVSFSRSAILALVISLIFLFIVFFFTDKKLFRKFLPIILSLIFLGGALFLLFKPLILTRIEASSRLEKISINERQEQNNTALEIISDNVWLGVGLGNYHNELLNREVDLKPYEAQPVHNVFLLIWSEIGLWGLLLFLYFIIYLFKINIEKLYYIPIFIALFVFMLFDHWLWSLPGSYLFLFFILSLTFYFKDDNLSS